MATNIFEFNFAHDPEPPLTLKARKLLCGYLTTYWVLEQNKKGIPVQSMLVWEYYASQWGPRPHNRNVQKFLNIGDKAQSRHDFLKGLRKQWHMKYEVVASAPDVAEADIEAKVQHSCDRCRVGLSVFLFKKKHLAKQNLYPNVVLRNVAFRGTFLYPNRCCFMLCGSTFPTKQ